MGCFENELKKNKLNQIFKSTGIVYNDFVELLLKSEAEEAEKIEKGRMTKKLTQEEIVGQVNTIY